MNHLEVKVKEQTYIIGIVKENKEYFWYLSPYNNSIFKTKVDLEDSNLEMVLFAIKENETLYSKKA